ncbi:hypothetical protein ACFKHW_39540 (plasmid) [Bradyrhizobium lupini]
MNGQLVLAQAEPVRHVDDADSVESTSVKPLIDNRMWTSKSGRIAIAPG